MTTTTTTPWSKLPEPWSKLPEDAVRSVLGFLSSADRSIDLSIRLRLAPHPIPRERIVSIERMLAVSGDVYYRCAHIAISPDSVGWSYQLYWRWREDVRSYDVWARTCFSGVECGEWGAWEYSRYHFIYPLYLLHTTLFRHGRLMRAKNASYR